MHSLLRPRNPRLLPESLPDTNHRIWDMVLNLVHPAALYVLFQLLMMDHLGKAPHLAALGPLEPISLGIYLLQFLGAWAVFYTVLLRDMGFGSPFGTILLLAALAGLLGQYFVFPDPRLAAPLPINLYLGGQLGLAAVLWPLTWRLWHRRRREWESREAATTSPHPPTNLAIVWLSPTLVEAADPGASAANAWFYDTWIWIAVLVPTVLAILLAGMKKKRAPVLPHLTDSSFDPEVLESEVPVVVHAYHSWSIGDRVIENQVLRLAAATQGRLRPYWLDLDKCPDTVARFPTLQEKSVALFCRGKLVWQSLGVQDHLTILREIDPFLPKTAALS